MNIASLYAKGPGYKFDLQFEPTGPTAIIGMNGCGKTTVLNIIAALTGTPNTEMLMRRALEYARIQVNTPEGPKTLEVNGWERDRIRAFKETLPTRTSYILTDNTFDDSFVGKCQDPIQNQKDLLLSLQWLGMDLRKQFVFDSIHSASKASLLVGETGAQRYLLTVGMRRAPEDVPILVDLPERHLHIRIKRQILSFLVGREQQVQTEQQIICATHCPEVLSSIDDNEFVTGYMHAQRKNQRLISLS